MTAMDSAESGALDAARPRRPGDFWVPIECDTYMGPLGTAPPVRRKRGPCWVPKDLPPYTGPLTLERKAELDRELEEMRRKNFEQFDKDLDEKFKQKIRDIISSVLD